MCKQFKTVLQSPYCYCLLTVSSHEKCYLLKHKQGNNRPNLKPKQVYQLIMACQLLHILFQEDQFINLLRLQVGPLGGTKSPAVEKTRSEETLVAGTVRYICANPPSS